LESLRVREENVHVISHPYAQELLTIIRDKSTEYYMFRSILEEIGYIIGLEIVKNMDTREVYTETPLGVKAKGIKIIDKDNVVIINVLRASIPLVNGLLKIFKKARLGFVVAQRLEDKIMFNNEGMKFEIKISYMNIPEIRREDTVIIPDPMIATASTILNTIPLIIKKGEPKRLIVASVIITSEAIKKIKKHYNKVELYTIAVDPKLNSKGYIVPGLGDAGDRYTGT